MVDRLPSSAQQMATRLLHLLRSQGSSSVRTGPTVQIASSSYHTYSQATRATTLARESSCVHVGRHSRSFSATSSSHVSAHRKQAGRDKARLRSMRQEEKLVRRREKEGYSHAGQHSSRDRKFSDPVEEDVEANIREYMAQTGPRGERLTRSQQERLLKQELKGLGDQLEKLEKKAKADQATQDLPELDDHTLDEIYQALMLPPPPTPEEARLARLEGGRRERSLRDMDKSEARGRRKLERTRRSLEALLPPSAAETKKERVTRDLRQKLLEATEKGRLLLPPSTPTVQKSEASLTTQVESGRAEEQVDMSALPYAERQEVRLQQLFARLALVHSSPSGTEQEVESLREIKSSLASRIAKILQDHKYELHPSARKKDQEDDRTNRAEDAVAEENVPPFADVRLDAKAPTLRTLSTEDVDQTTKTPSEDRSELIARAETMISNLGLHESRTFMLDGIEKLVRSASPASDSSAHASRLPLGVASIDEWAALAVASARADDAATLSRTMSLMHAAGYRPAPLSLYNDVLDVFAARGDVARCQEWLAQMSELGLVPDDHTYHSLTKAYVTSAQFLPALELLNSLEAAGRPASMATYTLVIDRLLDPVPVAAPGGMRKEERPEVQALAWNVFYHMRLHAHPIPDAPLYALMIRACARGVPQPHDIDDPTQNFASTTTTTSDGARRISDAERALDLFREMTTRYSVRPNAEVYNSLILACARRKDFYVEAFRLLREMVELAHVHDPLASESPADKGLNFAPDRYTFNALLQGCARNRDLARARWVLAEMIRTTLPLFDAALRESMGRSEVMELLAKRPNEETMCHVFHTYAAYVPPLKRNQLLRTGSGSNASPASPTPATTPANALPTSNAGIGASDPTQVAERSRLEEEGEGTTAEEAAQIFSALVPQTSSDLVSESRSLLARILADQPSGSTSRSDGGVEGPLGGVNPGVRLVNSYLTVLAAHLPAQHRARVLHSTLHRLPDEGGEPSLEAGLFSRLGLEPNEHSYRIVLEALCSQPGTDEHVSIVQSVWDQFQHYLAHPTPSFHGGTQLALDQDAARASEARLDAVQVQKAWSACIHFWAKHSPTDGLDRAMHLVRQFATLYPPLLPHNRTNNAPNPPRFPHKSIDLSPLPLPLKSLQALHVLSSPPEIQPEPELEPETEAGKHSQTRRTFTANPSLNFLNVQLLHHRLVRYGRLNDLAYLSWLLHRYAAAARS